MTTIDAMETPAVADPPPAPAPRRDPPAGDRGAAALRAKLSAPALTGTETPRPRLLEAVRSRPQARLVVVRAPAGFGKTTALAQIRLDLAQAGVRTAWLTLDAADNDPSRFLRALRCALDPLLGPDDDDEAAAGGDDVAGLHRLAGCEAPVALFLDEFDVLHEGRVLEWIRGLVSQLGPLGRVLVGSRTVPDLRLARLRARGQLVEIDAAALRFSEDETRELLGARQRGALAPALLAELHRKTEGWVTGLSLAALALDRPGAAAAADFVGRFSGTTLSVADYLLAEVLDRQPEPTRDFLLRTSILKVLTPELCDVLVPGPDSAALLRELGARNVLVAPVGGDDAPTYRYHSLFADFLSSELRRRSPALLPALHERAGARFEAHGRPVPAIDHYLETGDPARALPLLEQHGPALLADGRFRLLAKWFAKLPAPALAGHPVLAMTRLWTVCLGTGAAEARLELDASGLAHSGDPRVWPHVQALEAAILSMTDQVEAAYRVGPTMLARLPSGNPWADGALVHMMSGVFFQVGDSAQTLELIQASRRAEVPHKGQLHQMYGEVMEGVLDLLAGRIFEAHARFRTAWSASKAGHPSALGNSHAASYCALTHYERNQTARATELLRVHLPLARDLGLPDAMIGGYRMLARIAFQAGEVDEAFGLIAELERLGHDRRLARVRSSARLERSRLQLLQGKHAAAALELERALADGTAGRTREQRLTANEIDYEALARLRWQAMAGDASAAAAALASEQIAARGAQRLRRAMAIRLVQAVALARSGQEVASRRVLEEALQECHANGVVRMVLDEGPVLGTLVRQLHARAVGAGALLADARFVGYLAELLDGFGAALPPEPDDGDRPLLLDALTDKEIEALHLVAEGYSNVAMAEKLGISDSTVRTHLRSINSKLAVGSRMQAVAAARRLGLLR